MGSTIDSVIQTWLPLLLLTYRNGNGQREWPNVSMSDIVLFILPAARIRQFGRSNDQRLPRWRNSEGDLAPRAEDDPNFIGSNSRDTRLSSRKEPFL
jgi:hypothetical protein